MTSMYSQYQSRIQLIILIIFFTCFILLAKIFSIQIINKNLYTKIVTENTVKEIVKKGDRGLILSRDNEVLAETTKKYTFWVNTYRDNNEDLIISTLSELFQQQPDFYREKFKKEASYVMLEKNIPQFIALPLLNNIKNIKGLHADGLQMRHYPYRNLFSHIVGHVDSKSEGKAGIEKMFNDLLLPDKKRVKYNKSQSGNLNRSIDSNQPIINDGLDIQLTIDVKIQEILHSEILKGLDKYSALSANGVIINPINGEIIAMVSVPDYNPNNYYNYDINTYNNHSISSAYEPGSTYKVVTTSLALDNGIIDFDQEFNCENGEFRYSSIKNPSLFKIIHDHEPHGVLTVSQILIESSNIGIFKIADLIGDQRVYKFSKKFGFGTKTGVELPNESAGSLKKFDKWDWLSNNSISIGQEMSATTLQTALAYSAVANGGYLLKPTVVNRIDGIKNNSRSPNVIRKIMHTHTANKMVDVLVETVKNGTGFNASIDGYAIAGKTGTAEKFINGSYSEKEFISSFASFFPAYKPEYVLVINVDSPAYGFHWGNEAAGKITREVLSRIIADDPNIYPQIEMNNHANVGKKKRLNKSNTNEIEPSMELMPNFKGKTLKEALVQAKKIGVVVEPYGYSGRIVWQSTPVGSEIFNNPICKVKLENS